MARRKVLGFAVKYGVKYGPHVLVAAQTLREPATAYAQKRLADARDRRAALAEAATLTDGSALRVFHAGRPVWVVYSGADPVSSHPPVQAALATVVERADVTQRVRPGDAKSGRRRPADKSRARLRRR